RTLSDDDLVFACQQKKQTAWRVFIGRFQKLAISIVAQHGLGTGFEDWEDLWKKAQIRLYLRIKDCERGKVVSFVYSFVHNVCHEKIKKESQERKLLVSLNNHIKKNEQGNTEASTFSQQLGPNQVAEPAKKNFTKDEPLRLMINQEKQEELEEAIRMLPAEFSEVLWLAEMEDYTEKEASDELSIPIGTVKSRLSRARPKLFQRIRTEKLRLWKQLSSTEWVKELLKKLWE
ncbi:MAG TPA: hypothetical protein DHV62_01295, partial [Elusimicrobia bacterium]|nr:hypothetical protein [Elusimicrobiota bacterium]